MGTKNKAKRKKMGRPPIPKRMRKTIQVKARVTPAEAKVLQAEAERLGITISDLLMRPWRKGQKGDK